ncbi:MAG: VWA domain-containing protein [Ruminococcus flavefaciens]|nr:VWA domain-containing protein [Ruminococcus flavefaciens]
MKSVYKKLTAILLFLLALVIAFTVTACGSRGGKYDSSDGYGGGYGTAPDHSDSAAAPDGDYSDGRHENTGGSQLPIVKQLTCAEWRDALNYDFWLQLFEKEIYNDDQTVSSGIFSEYAVATRGLDSSDMHEVSVTLGEAPVVGARVILYDENIEIYSAVTDSAGKAYVFGKGTQIKATSGEFSATEAVTEGITEIALSDCEAVENELEIMLVVDTTGSMGDELSFLCDELAGVVTRVSSALDCKIRLGLLFYRDTSDDYVTRKYDFVDVTSSAGLDTVIMHINDQRSSGGGDYPEAVDRALSEAVDMGWNENSKTKLLFHVLDAPYHDRQENQSIFSSAVKAAAQKGIRIIPVAASGLDTLGQYIMRSAALLTGGTYAFLTDDSGIGDSHEMPAVGEFTVEYLSDLMVRLIKGYYTGTFDEPIVWTQSESVV